MKYAESFEFKGLIPENPCGITLSGGGATPSSTSLLAFRTDFLRECRIKIRHIFVCKKMKGQKNE